MLLLKLKNTTTLVSTLLILGWTWQMGLDDWLRCFMVFYFLIDFILFSNITKTDMVFHHMVSLLMILFYWNNEDTLQLILTEISTPFLVMFRLHICEDVNKVLFILTFFYFRIYNLGRLLVKRRYETNNPAVWLLFLLFSLNCWWAEIIARKLVPHPVKTILYKLTPYTHFLILSCVSSRNHLLMNSSLIASSFASYLWHHYKTPWWYILDLVCLHSISFLYSLQNAPSSNLVWVSFPFHVADVFFYYFYHRFWLLSSIGYDVMLVFLSSRQDFLWLLGWLLVALLLSRQTFGQGCTQAVLHLLISFIVFRNG
jgi:hypothetical protein